MHLPLLRKITSPRILRVLTIATMCYLVLGIVLVIAAVPVAIWYTKPDRGLVLAGMVIGGLFVWMMASLLAHDLTELAREQAARRSGP